MKHIEVFRDKNDGFVRSKVTELRLNQKLKKENQLGKYSGAEQCFRIATPWYHLNMGYTNPYNVGKVHAELMLIEKHIHDSLNGRNSFFESLKNKELIFYGVGVGDTEIALVDWLLKLGEKKVYVTGIDVNKEFLDNFSVALRNRLLEEPEDVQIFYRGYHALFEQIDKTDLKSKFKKAHICLGGTIGNFYDQEEIAEMFFDMMDEGDILVLGFQLDTYLSILFEKYKQNSLFSEFVLSHIPKDERKELYWLLHEPAGTIIAKHGGVEIFRSKKYDLDWAKNLFTSKDFVLVYQSSSEDKNVGIQVYVKKKEDLKNDKLS